MRFDTVFYILGIICFVLAIYIPINVVNLISAAFVVVLILFGLLFMTFGYSARPKKYKIPPPPPIKPAEAKPEQKAPQPPPPPPPSEPSVPAKELTKIKGIGPKRLAQLNALQILSAEDLAKWSAENLAAKIGVSKKITAKWIEDAKTLLQESA